MSINLNVWISRDLKTLFLGKLLKIITIKYDFQEHFMKVSVYLTVRPFVRPPYNSWAGEKKLFDFSLI